jgi:tRNA(fMet)-specific endonuclease VapC
MLQFLLDTDQLTLYDHLHPLVRNHVAAQGSGVVGLPLVAVEEYLRGRLARVARAKDGIARTTHYALFLDSLQLAQRFPIAPFDQAAEDQYQLLRGMRLRIGTQDQKIAAIALATNVILVTRNKSDFGQIPGLVLDDWSV